MPLPGQHTPLWDINVELDAYPPLEHDVAVNVAVVGGGITGLTTALLCKEAGLTVAVLEADRVGSGTTGGTTGKLTTQHDLFYASALEDLGDAVVSEYVTANRNAMQLVEEIAARHGIDPYLSRVPSYVYTTTDAELPRVRAEADAARRLGLPASYVEGNVGLPFDVLGAVRFDGQLQLHPRRLTSGLAAAVAGDGSSVYEHTRALNITEHGDGVEVVTAPGTVRARHAVVATLMPFTFHGFEFAKARPTRSYGIAVELDGEPPEPMFISAESLNGRCATTTAGPAPT